MKYPTKKIPPLLVFLSSLAFLLAPNLACVQPVPVPDFWCIEKDAVRELFANVDCPEIQECIQRADREGKCLGGIGIEIDLFAATGTQCACGFTVGNCPPGLNLEICAVSILVVNQETHQVIGKSNELVFDENAATQASLEGVFGGNWRGFFANAPEVNPLDLQKPFVYKLWLTTLSDFKGQCRLRAAAGEANPDGTIRTDGEHPVVPLYGISLDGSDVTVGEFDPDFGPVDQNDDIRVTGIDRNTAQEGELIIVQGEGFGDDPDDLCVATLPDNNGNIVPFNVVGARNDRIVLKLPFVAPDRNPGPIMIERGNGRRHRCDLVRYIEFEDHKAGTEFRPGVTFVDSGVKMEVCPFVFSSGGTTDQGFVQYQNGNMAGHRGVELCINNATLKIQDCLPTEGIWLHFGEFGGNLNITINGQLEVFEDMNDIDGKVIGGVNVSVVGAGGAGQGLGRLHLDGKIEQFSIGGQEFYIDHLCIKKEKNDCKIIGHPWCWKPHAFPGNPGVVDVNFQPVPLEPAPNVCVFPGNVNDGVICTFIKGNFPAGSKVQIYARARDANNRGKDVGYLCLLCVVPRTAEEMAQCIKEYVQCAFAAGDVEIGIKCETVDEGVVKITMFSVDGQPISWGNLDIRIRKGRPGGPRIDRLIPRGNEPGDLVIIEGEDFAGGPDDFCLVARAGDRAVGLQVVEAEQDRLLARIEEVPENFKPNQIMIQEGHGHRGRWIPAFDDLEPGGPVWTWKGVGDFGAHQFPVELVALDLTGRPPRPDIDICYREELVDGRLCTIIGPQNWNPNYVVTIFARAHTVCEQIDTRVPRTRFRKGGTPLECARRIKDIVQCAFLQQADALVNATCTPLPDGRVKITVERADGMPITWGKFEICIKCPPPTPDIDDDGIEMDFPGRGGIIKIPGNGFGNRPADLCVVLCNPGILIPFEPFNVTDKLICARIGAVPPNAVPGPIMVVRGRGRLGTFIPARQFADVAVPRRDVFLWHGEADVGKAMTAKDFTLTPAPPTRRRCFFGDNVDGQICTIIEGDWVKGTALDIRIRAHNLEKNRLIDLGTRSITLTRQGTLQECADRIKDFLRCVDRQRGRNLLDIKCERLDNNRIKMILWFKDGCPIDKGTFNIWAQIKGDMNDDGVVNVFDIERFVRGLTDPTGFRTDFRLDPGIFADLNNDGVNNVFDIEDFVVRLTGGGQPVAALRQLRALIPNEDLDGDGIINADEAIAGTDPANGSDFLHALRWSTRWQWS